MTENEGHSANPLVTVVITTYDRPEFLQKAVDTVTAQRYDPIELIVVDDHSPTPADDVLNDRDLDFERFEIHRHAENQGANAARNTGIEVASGEYIAFLDDDDRWDPEKIATQVNAFQDSGPEVGVVYTGRKVVDDDGGVTRVWAPDQPDGDMTKALLCRNVVGTQSSVMVRSDIAKETPFDETIPRWADLEWYVAASTKCEFAAVDEPLVIYDRRAHNRISDDYEVLEESYELFIEKYRDLAASYGPLFERKMLAWSAYRVGNASLNARYYDMARRYFFRALALYPFEPTFLIYAATTVGGRTTHRISQHIKRILPHRLVPIS
ncbi:glycosyltransferase family 2 protein [Haloarcula sp. CBA1131]|uniref:glycosyltransferase family 2 protein n=1 Tax=Haloarcula sp. CBA1131 TaxID=1853686 RepID=UPI0012479AA0|nr:glycosyltransferase family 2 protein [Haloarcula sp. CBA1131]KAA9404509.1 glycosyltransferase family 2 protein [Haloarcula sp. CBA1131]